jgi:hypothetical protein
MALSAFVVNKIADEKDCCHYSFVMVGYRFCTKRAAGA